MRIRRPFAEYRLTALGRQRAQLPAEGVRVDCNGLDEARTLVRELELDDPFRVAGLLLEAEPTFGDGLSGPGLLDQLARCIDRGLIEVVRIPVLPVSSEMPELFDMPFEPEPFENEINDGFSLLADAEVESALVIEVEVEIEPAPTIEFNNDIEPAPSLEFANDVEQPAPAPGS